VDTPPPPPAAELLGDAPVQSFTSPAIPVGPDTPLEPRHGRPLTQPLLEGVAPLQSFTSPAIPVGPDTPLEPRHGRPERPATSA
jgi:hypothetical protein